MLKSKNKEREKKVNIKGIVIIFPATIPKVKIIVEKTIGRFIAYSKSHLLAAGTCQQQLSRLEYQQIMSVRVQ